MFHSSGFRDRQEAGQQLAAALKDRYAGRPDLLVLALPRGGVPVGWEVATTLGAPLDVYVVRKLGHPAQPELAIGAIAQGGVLLTNEDVLDRLDLSREVLDEIAAREQVELDRRLTAYRDGPPPDVAGRTVIVVDDGLATGATMRAALQALRSQSPARLVVAVPVAPRGAVDALRDAADDVVVVLAPRDFRAVGQWYDDFRQTTDDEVRELLRDQPQSR
jgi:putative phosphoribosyl transferase